MFSLWLLYGHDNQLCSRVALLYLDILFHCFHLVNIDNLVTRVMELGLGNKTFMSSHALYFRDMDYSNVTLCGLPTSVRYHRDYLEMCHQLIEQFGLEVCIELNL